MIGEERAGIEKLLLNVHSARKKYLVEDARMCEVRRDGTVFLIQRKKSHRRNSISPLFGVYIKS